MACLNRGLRRPLAMMSPSFRPSIHQTVEAARIFCYQIDQALAQARWPDGFVCARCGARRAHAFSRFGQAYWQCRACRAQTSLRAGTLFAASKLPLTVWFLALYLLGQSKNAIAVLALRWHLGVCYRSAWRLKHKLMQAMAQDEADRRLGGVVQVDDAYLGGAPPGPGRGGLQRRSGGVSGGGDTACPHGDPGPTGQGRHRGRRGTLGQRRAGQPQARPGRHLPCLRFLQVCRAVPRRSRLAVQSLLQPRGPGAASGGERRPPPLA